MFAAGDQIVPPFLVIITVRFMASYLAAGIMFRSSPEIRWKTVKQHIKRRISRIRVVFGMMYKLIHVIRFVLAGPRPHLVEMIAGDMKQEGNNVPIIPDCLLHASFILCGCMSQFYTNDSHV